MLFDRKKGTEVAQTPSEFIADYLNHGKFCYNLHAVAGHTLNDGLEGGFAVYRKKRDGFTISEPVLPQEDWWLYTDYAKYIPEWEDSRYHPRYQLPSHMLTQRYRRGVRPRDEAEDRRWRQDPTNYNGVRSDLAFMLHSHPRSSLYPSTPDIRDSWSAIEVANPFYVDAILTAERGLAKLLLWRRNRNTPHGPDTYKTRYRYNSRRVTSTEEFLKFCKDVGINALTASFDTTNGIFSPPVVEIAEALTTNS